MNIEIVGRNGDIGTATREHASKKLDKVLKFLEEPIDARFTFDADGHRHVVELHLAHRFGTLQGHSEGEGWTEAVNAVVDKVEKQARRGRERFQDRRRRAQRAGDAASWPVDVVEKASVGGGARPRVIKSSLIQIKPMSLDEAAIELEASTHDFVVFRDAETDEVNVLYKRKDNHYGLIAPGA
jgi:putative sigma-54 modulation protein